MHTANINRGLNLFDFNLVNEFTTNTKVYFKLTLYAPNFKSMDIEVRDKKGAVGTSLLNHTSLTGDQLNQSINFSTRLLQIYRVKVLDFANVKRIHCLCGE